MSDEMALWKYDDAIERVLLAGTDRATGEISDECLVELEALEIDKKAKALAVVAYLKSELREASAIHAYADELKENAERERGRACVHENKAARLDSYLQKYHPEDSEKISDARGSLRWTQNPQKLAELNLDVLPDRWFRQPPTPERVPDKAPLLAALKAGDEIAGASIAPRTKRLVIK